MRKVAIVGVGTSPWRSRYEDYTWRALGLQVTKNAFEDAHLSVKEIDSVVYFYLLRSNDEAAITYSSNSGLPWDGG